MDIAPEVTRATALAARQRTGRIPPLYSWDALAAGITLVARIALPYVDQLRPPSLQARGSGGLSPLASLSE
jgi:hypothetical protein